MQLLALVLDLLSLRNVGIFLDPLYNPTLVPVPVKVL